MEKDAFILKISFDNFLGLGFEATYIVGCQGGVQREGLVLDYLRLDPLRVRLISLFFSKTKVIKYVNHILRNLKVNNLRAFLCQNF